MRIFYSIDEIDISKPSVVTVGSFDGLHKGHQVIIKQLHSLAENDHYLTILVTFHPHPKEVLAPPGSPPARTLNTAGSEIKVPGTVGITDGSRSTIYQRIFQNWLSRVCAGYLDSKTKK